MMNSDVIAHSGRIIEVGPDSVSVEIISESACGACHAKSLCGLSEAVSKVVTVPVRSGIWNVGQEVEVLLSKTMGFKAVWIGYAIPLVVLLAVLLGLFAAGVPEYVAGLSAIAAVGIYYLCIYLLRDKLKNEYSFNIKAE